MRGIRKVASGRSLSKSGAFCGEPAGRGCLIRQVLHVNESNRLQYLQIAMMQRPDDAALVTVEHDIIAVLKILNCLS